MKDFLTLAVQLVVLSIFAVVSTHSGSTEDGVYKRLKNTLLQNYDPALRPVIRADSTTTNVNFALVLNYITSLDEKLQTLTVQTWLKLVWVDEHLQWNPKDYDGLKQAHFAIAEVWKPDVVLCYSAHASEFRTTADSHVIVDSDGNVTWVPPATFRTFCALNLANYPFDSQQCKIEFASWSQLSEVINLTLSGEFGVSAQPPAYTNPEWELLNISATLEKRLISQEHSYAFSVVVINLDLQRRHTMYYFTIVLPIVAVAILTLVSFWLQPGHPAKIRLGCWNILITVFIMLFIVWRIGHSSQLPRAVYVASLTLIAVCTSIIFAIITSIMARANLMVRPPSPLIRILKKIDNAVCCLCLTADGSTEQTAQLRFTEENVEVVNEDTSTSAVEQKVDSKQEWLLVAKAVDKILFVGYSLFFLCVHL